MGTRWDQLLTLSREGAKFGGLRESRGVQKRARQFSSPERGLSFPVRGHFVGHFLRLAQHGFEHGDVASEFLLKTFRR